MKKLKVSKRTGLIAMIIAISVGMIGCGAHRGHHRGLNIDRVLKRSTKKLDLNMEQQSKLRQVLETGEKFKISMSERHDEFTEPLKQNLAQSTLDVDQLNEHFLTFETDLSEFRKTMLTEYAEFHSSLTDEQRAKLLGYVEKIEKHRRH